MKSHDVDSTLTTGKAKFMMLVSHGLQMRIMGASAAIAWKKYRMDPCHTVSLLALNRGLPLLTRP